MRTDNILKSILDLVANVHRSKENEKQKLSEIEELQKQAKLDADISTSVIVVSKNSFAHLPISPTREAWSCSHSTLAFAQQSWLPRRHS
jgi:hypothetical protein